MLFNEMFWNYVAYKEYNSLKSSSISTYIKYYNAQIKDYFADIKLENISSELISEFIAAMRGKGLERKYAKGILNLVYAVIRYAAQEYSEYSSLLSLNMPRIKASHKRVESFTEKEQLIIESRLINDGSPISCGILLCLYTGIRIGELCALRADDFDFAANTLCICKTLQRVKDRSCSNGHKTKIIIDTPKSESSIRLIPMPDFIADVYKSLFTGVSRSCFALTLSENRFVEPRLLEFKFSKLLAELKLSHKNFHVTRHTFANNMIDLGADIKLLSELLGHSSVSVTMNEYIHPSFERKVRQVALLNRKFIDNHRKTYA